MLQFPNMRMGMNPLNPSQTSRTQRGVTAITLSTAQAAWQMLARTLEVYEGSESMHRTQYTTRKATKPCGWCDSAVAKAVRDIDLTRKLGSPNTCLLQNRGQVCPDCTSVGFGMFWAGTGLPFGFWIIAMHSHKSSSRFQDGSARSSDMRMLRSPGGMKSEGSQYSTMCRMIQYDPQCHNTSWWIYILKENTCRNFHCMIGEKPRLFWRHCDEVKQQKPWVSRMSAPKTSEVIGRLVFLTTKSHWINMN